MPEPASRPTTGNHRGWRLPLLVLTLSVCMTLGMYILLVRQAEDRQREEMQREADQVSSEIRDRLSGDTVLLNGLRGFLQANPRVTPEEWRIFANALHIADRPERAYGFLPGKKGQPLLGEFAPAWLPVLHRAQPGIRDRGEVLLLTFPTAAAETARSDFALILPVYRTPTPPATEDERREAYLGSVLLTDRLSDFLATLNTPRAGTLALRIATNAGARPTGSPATPLSLLIPEAIETSAATPARPTLEQDLVFGDGTWRLQFFKQQAAPALERANILLVAGLLLSLLLALLSRVQVTSRQRAENLAREMTGELRRSETRFKLAAEGSNDGIWDRDLEGGRVWFSERLWQLLGLARHADQQVELDLFMAHIHPEDRPRINEAFRRHIRERVPLEIDYRFRKGDGQEAWFHLRGQAVWDANGRAIHLAGSLSDITERRAADIKLLRYRDFLATILQSIPHPVFVKNQQRQFIVVNPAFCALAGRAEAEILGSTELGHVPLPPLLAERVRQADTALFAGGGEQLDEFDLPLPRGMRTVISRKALATDPDGQPILIGTLTDVTHWREAERQRARADMQRRAIVDAATEVSIIATDLQGRITLFNHGAEKMLGYSAHELMGREVAPLLHDPAEMATRAQDLSALLGRPVSGFEVFVARPVLTGAETRTWTYLRHDGSRLTVNLSVTAVRDEHGQLNGYLGIATDITELKAAQAELEKQSARMKTIVDHIPGGVSLIDRELRFTAINEKLKDVLNFPDALFANGAPSLYEVALFNARRGEYGPGTPEAIAEAVVTRARTPQAHQFERTRPNGRTIEVRGTPLPDGGFVTIYTDITERKAAEAELIRHRDHLQELVDERTAALLQAKEAAEQASEAKSEFLANISHELRTPMHSILSFAALGEEKARTAGHEKLVHYQQRIQQSGERLLRLLNDLLDLSKLEAGMMMVVPHEQEITPIIREAMTESEAWAAGRGIRFVLQAFCDDTRAAVDAHRFGQVIRNLLSNAIKYSPDNGEIHIELMPATLPRRVVGEYHDILALDIMVRDQGIGIPDNELELIFDKFVQSSKTKTGAGGTGLGLSICREIVLAHRGRIVARNHPAGGAAFVVTLPRNLISG